MSDTGDRHQQTNLTTPHEAVSDTPQDLRSFGVSDTKGDTSVMTMTENALSDGRVVGIADEEALRVARKACECADPRCIRARSSPGETTPS